MNVIYVDERKLYLEIDNIRIVVEDGSIAGWYAPAGLEA